MLSALCLESRRESRRARARSLFRHSTLLLGEASERRRVALDAKADLAVLVAKKSAPLGVMAQSGLLLGGGGLTSA